MNGKERDKGEDNKIDGRALAKEIRQGVKEEIDRGYEITGQRPCLGVVMVGEDDASKVYIRQKEKASKKVGIESEVKYLAADSTLDEVISTVEDLNQDHGIHGILVQLPLPNGLDRNKILEAIDPSKDVDGFTPTNFGRLMLGNETLSPCTPKGVIYMLDSVYFDYVGAEVVVINHSPVVGKPLALMLLNRNATVRVCHVHTRDLAVHTKGADAVIVAAGVPELIKANMVKEGAVVIDVGINRVEGKIVGDVDYHAVKAKAGAISPVPGGPGPMTVAMLMQNTLAAFKDQTGLD